MFSLGLCCSRQTDLLIVLLWRARSSEAWPSQSGFVPLWTTRTSLVFWTAAVWARSAFWDICHWGLTRRNYWTTNHLRAVQHSLHLQRGRCLCRRWKKEDRILRLSLCSPEPQMKTSAPGGEQTSSLLLQVGIDDEPPAAAALPPNQRAPPAGRTGLVWRASGCSPSPTKTRLKGGEMLRLILHFHWGLVIF